jgi:protein TonB
VAYSYSIDDPAKNSKRTLAFFLVVIIHALFFWVLASGLGAKMVQTVMGPVETKIIEELPDDDKEPPPPPPDIEQPPPYVPPPEVSVDIAIDTGPTTAISNVTSERPVAPPPPVAAKPVERAVVKTPPSTAGKGARTSLPEYPPASRRAGEEGTVNLQVYVLETGRAGEIKIAKSSGFPKLDEAAVKEVQRNWRFVPGKEDGKPVPMWHIFAVTFRLTD